MRVLLVTHNSLPHHRAGVETYTHQLARALRETTAVTVAATRKVISLATGTVRSVMHDGVPMLEVINNLDHGGVEAAWRNPVMERAFADVLGRTRPDVVHFQHVLYWSTGLPRMAAAHGARCVFTLHDFFLLCARMGQLIDHRGEACAGPSAERCAPCMAAMSWGQSAPARRWIRRLTAVRRLTGLALDRPMRVLERTRTALRGGETSSTATANDPLPPAEWTRWRELFRGRDEACRQMIGAVDAFVTPSRTLRERFVAWGIPSEQIHLVPQGLDAEPFAAVVRRPGERLRLAFLGTIAPHKGVLDLVHAVAALPANRVQLAVYGRDDQHRAYAQRCREAARGCDHITFSGWLTREQVPGAYADIDVLCVPSRWDECAPLTIQEAFMASTPCVVSGRGGLAELVTDGVDGLHARSGDVDDWTRVLRRLLDEPGLLAHLRAGIGPVPSVADHARELARFYQR